MEPHGGLIRKKSLRSDCRRNTYTVEVFCFCIHVSIFPSGIGTTNSASTFSVLLQASTDPHSISECVPVRPETRTTTGVGPTFQASLLVCTRQVIPCLLFSSSFCSVHAPMLDCSRSPKASGSCSPHFMPWDSAGQNSKNKMEAMNITVMSESF